MVKILIIEDDPFVQRMYKRMFSLKKYKVEMATEGVQGIKLAKSYNPDLILLDIMLPGMNGLEVLKKLRGDNETKLIPVLMLTNLGEEEVVEEAKRLGADFYMVKADFSPEQVLKKVDEYLKRTSHSSV